MMELVYCFDFKSTGTTLQLMDIQDEGALHFSDWPRHVSTIPRTQGKPVTEEPERRHLKRRASVREMSKHSCGVLGRP